MKYFKKFDIMMFVFLEHGKNIEKNIIQIIYLF